ncbi:hypothetical protein GCM10010384_57410 [Streptomyces djakartensis]|uniref:Uncharacterized protein n=1 Tax=Streptomyces djakartensis TaxID=68193 RepID=A0ABQ3ACZ6_9ACTN|nr:hypothetical protein GCM10010384_57410 [Streptomyces djakartensis]
MRVTCAIRKRPRGSAPSSPNPFGPERPNDAAPQEATVGERCDLGGRDVLAHLDEEARWRVDWPRAAWRVLSPEAKRNPRTTGHPTPSSR